MTEKEMLVLLCELTLNPQLTPEAYAAVASLDAPARTEFHKLADANHVIVRALEPVSKRALMNGDLGLKRWADECIEAEKGRVQHALLYLHAICSELEAAGCPTTVMKSLEHYPDLGSDLDIYSTADAEKIVAVMKDKFNAHVEAQSWGDRIAKKWNFTVPGLPEAVEVHVQRLGQMGEHTWMAKRFVTRRVVRNLNGRNYFEPAPEERVVVATLQRMYRHFYFRVCDLVNSAALVESGRIDFAELQNSTARAGIWPGIATYLVIVSDFVKKHRGTALALPQEVTDAAICGGDKIEPKNRFLRVPILPHGANLYTAQVTKAAFNGDLPGTFRLGMLPYLATAAAVSYKLTGSDKGIW